MCFLGTKLMAWNNGHATDSFVDCPVGYDIEYLRYHRMLCTERPSIDILVIGIELPVDYVPTWPEQKVDVGVIPATSCRCDQQQGAMCKDNSSCGSATEAVIHKLMPVCQFVRKKCVGVANCTALPNVNPVQHAQPCI